MSHPSYLYRVLITTFFLNFVVLPTPRKTGIKMMLRCKKAALMQMNLILITTIKVLIGDRQY